VLVNGVGKGRAEIEVSRQRPPEARDERVVRGEVALRIDDVGHPEQGGGHPRSVVGEELPCATLLSALADPTVLRVPHGKLRFVVKRLRREGRVPAKQTPHQETAQEVRSVHMKGQR
jgi:hypothetical protein